MNREQFAEMLHGRRVGHEMTSEEEKLAKESGLVVCFGYSDDNLELRGGVNEEIGAYEGGSAFLVKKKDGKIDAMDESDIEEVEDLMNDKELDFSLPRVEIVGEWGPSEPECSWLIKSDLPHSTFDIMEDGDLFCRGIVIELNDIHKALG